MKKIIQIGIVGYGNIGRAVEASVERNPDMSRGLRWHTKEASRCEGDVGSPTHKLYEFIESGNLHKYPHKNNYHMIKGPNCNAFIQWIIDQVPEANLSLPWNAWGKSFKGYV